MVLVITHNSADNNNEEIINALLISENDEVIHVKIPVIDEDTPRYQVLDRDEFAKGISRQKNIEYIVINLD